jgi:hypothetical protein
VRAALTGLAGTLPNGSRSLWVPKTCATWADAPQLAVGSVSRLASGGHVSGGPGCDDLSLVGLKLIFLIVSRAVSLLGLSRRESWWKDAEILMRPITAG